MSYNHVQPAYRMVDGYSGRRPALGGPSTTMIADSKKDIMVTQGSARLPSSGSPRAAPRFGGGRLTAPGVFDSHARPTRFGGGRLGQLDTVGEGITAVESILGGVLGGGNGGLTPARKSLLDSYYTRAIAGDYTGVAAIQAWITDQPPHPKGT